MLYTVNKLQLHNFVLHKKSLRLKNVECFQFNVFGFTKIYLME